MHDPAYMTGWCLLTATSTRPAAPQCTLLWRSPPLPPAHGYVGGLLRMLALAHPRSLSLAVSLGGWNVAKRASKGNLQTLSREHGGLLGVQSDEGSKASLQMEASHARLFYQCLPAVVCVLRAQLLQPGFHTRRSGTSQKTSTLLPSGILPRALLQGQKTLNCC